MSLFRDSDECPTCFGITGWAGERARRNPLRAHLACTCSERTAEIINIGTARIRRETEKLERIMKEVRRG